MSDFVLIDGDRALFMPTFGAATVVVQPGRLSGSGPMTIGGKPTCVSGDEGSVNVPGCTYVAPPYVIPGTGTLTIDALGSNQLASTSKTGDIELMVKGGKFTAKFSVVAPAMQPPPGPGSPTPDSSTEYSGSGRFLTTNTKIKAG
jgi:hypothetical protein